VITFSYKPRRVAISRGFTLIELLVVCAIIGVLLAITVPTMTGLSKSNALNNGGRLLSNILTIARSEAINQRRLVQVRIATKWMSGTTEDTGSSYRKFSVWRRPQPDDAQQATGSDPYVQISKWETLPTGITFETDPALYNFSSNTSDPRYPGTYALDSSLSNHKSSIPSGNNTVDVAWIEFAPTGNVTTGSSTPGRIYLLLTEGFWNGSVIVSTNKRTNWLVAAIDTLMGRSTVLRP